MSSIIARILLWGLILSLLVFTAVRTLHFLGLTFPADQAYMAWLGLAAFDGGVLLWYFFATQAASGFWQRSIAYLMIAVCMVGVCICTIADMLLVSSNNGLVRIPPNTAIVALYGVMGVIIINVVAGVVVHLVDPVQLQHMAEEEARSTIQLQAIRNIKERSASIAGDVAQQLGEQWQQETYRNLQLEPPKKKGIAVAERLTEKS